jgi:DNA polymerase III delta prime subunit
MSNVKVICCICGLSSDIAGRMVAGLNGMGICEKCIKYCCDLFERNKNSNSAPQPPTPPKQQNVSKADNQTLDKLLSELNALIGLKTLKEEVKSIINQIKIRKIKESKGLKSVDMSNHLVFMGNPGTGKTTVARILASIYCKLGLLSKGHLVETDRSGLVAGYVGQTAIKTKKVVDEARGGILFIDEAYSLSPKSENDFGKEAIDTLLKIMEDNRDDFIVIVAGYTDDMKEFLKTNPGLESRFNNFIDFEDYNASELYEIFANMCKKNKYVIENTAIELLKQHFLNVYKNKSANYANARDVRNFFEKALKRQYNRLASVSNLTDEELTTLTKNDLFDDAAVQAQELTQQEIQIYFWNELQIQLKNKSYKIDIKDFTKDVNKYYAASEKRRHRYFGFDFEIYPSIRFRVEMGDQFFYGFTPNNKQLVEITQKISSLFIENKWWSGYKSSDKFDIDFWKLNSENYERLKDTAKREGFITGLANEIDWYINEFIKKAKESGV